MMLAPARRLDWHTTVVVMLVVVIRITRSGDTWRVSGKAYKHVGQGYKASRALPKAKTVTPKPMMTAPPGRAACRATIL
jgi:hypothetical protein